MTTRTQGKLSHKQEQAISALLTCATVEQAASSIGVTSRTLWNWLAQPHFRAEYDRRASAGADLLRTQIAALSEKAVNALTEALESSSDGVKVQASKIVLSRLYPETLIQRIDDAGQEQSGPIPAELLPYLREEEIAQIEQLLAIAQGRRQAEQQARQTIKS